jgi:ATP-dependent Zn protease
MGWPLLPDLLISWFPMLLLTGVWIYVMRSQFGVSGVNQKLMQHNQEILETQRAILQEMREIKDVLKDRKS